MKFVKKIFCALCVLVMLMTVAGCSVNPAEKPNGTDSENSTNANNNNLKENVSTELGGNVLVAYFSCTNTTEGIAEIIADETSGTLYEIVAADPYTEDDLKYYTNGRADKEQADPSCRPAISGSVSDMSAYDTVFIGYPIWHGQAPRIISTFLESNDFSGKTIVPFCTSHSSGIGSFMGSFVVSLIAVKAVHWFHVPNHVLTIPSVIPMVPGVLMYR